MEKLRMSCICADATRLWTAQTRDYRMTLPLPARGKGAGRRLLLRDRHRDELAGATARHQQQHRVAGLDARTGGLEGCGVVYRLVADAQDHVTRLQARLCGSATRGGD